MTSQNNSVSSTKTRQFRAFQAFGLLILFCQTTSLAQVALVGDYNVTWDVLDSSNSSAGSASASFTLGSGAPADGQLYPFTSNGTLPSWFSSISFIVNIGGTSYDMAKTDVTGFWWNNSIASPTAASPTQFQFRGPVDIIGSGTSGTIDQITGSGNELKMAFTVGATSYTVSNPQFSAVPEPEEWAAIASGGLLAFAIWHRRSRKAAKA